MKKVLLALSLLSTSLMAQVATSADPSTKETKPDVVQNDVRRLQPNEHFLNLPGATTIDAPPEGFDPITASDQELAFYGLPPHPDRNTESEKFAHWAKAMKASKTRIVPVLQQTNRFNGPAQGIRPASVETELSGPGGVVTNNNLLSDNWSGYVTPAGNSTFYYIVSDMIVPHAEQPIGTCAGTTDGVEWVGIDGWMTTNDVLQAGVEFDTFCASNVTNVNYYAWYEWFPANQVSIPNFPVKPGDDVFVEVWHTSPTQGFAYFVNEDTNQCTEVGFTAPSGVKLVGDKAEWIVERPLVFGSLPTLTNFTTIPFYDAYAVTESGIRDTVGAMGISMSDSSGNVLSFPVSIGSESFVAQTPGH